VLSVVNIGITVWAVCDAMSCGRYQHSSQIFVPTYQIIWHHIPEDYNLSLNDTNHTIVFLVEISTQNIIGTQLTMTCFFW